MLARSFFQQTDAERRAMVEAGFANGEAEAADEDNRLAGNALAALRPTGLFSDVLGLSFDEFAKTARLLGEYCLSTAFVWVQHAQQVASLAHHAPKESAELLADVERGSIIGSVTTEPGKGGTLVRADAPLVDEGQRIRLRRDAPIVGYAHVADWFVITMRAAPDAAPNDVRLALVRRDDEGRIEVKKGWNVMGMRGTQSLPVEFDVLIDRRRVVPIPLREIATVTMIPMGHIGWSAMWLGAASACVTRYVERAARDRGTSSDLLMHRLGRIRVELDVNTMLVASMSREFDQLRAEGASRASYEQVGRVARLNSLKVFCSESSSRIANDLLELAGLGIGYKKRGPLQLERVLRDLKAAPLMFHNDRLLSANGRMLFVDDQMSLTLE